MKKEDRENRSSNKVQMQSARLVPEKRSANEKVKEDNDDDPDVDDEKELLKIVSRYHRKWPVHNKNSNEKYSEHSKFKKEKAIVLGDQKVFKTKKQLLF